MCRGPNRSTIMHGGHRIARLAASLVITASLFHGQPAHADARVAELTKLLASSSDKARLSAVAALARLNDRTALKPLVTALRDPSPQVRALAATALGRLGHKAALPALKAAAADADASVRTQAREAAIAVARVNHLPDPWPAPSPAAPAAAARTSKYGGHAGFGRQARVIQNRPELYVAINSAADDSPGKTDKPTRKAHGEILRKTLTESFQSTPVVTTIAADAERWSLRQRQLDLSVTKLDVVLAGNLVEVEAQLRLAISDQDGKMLSFLSGGAKVQVPRKGYNARYLPNLRKEALENAMRGMVDKLVLQLRAKPNS